MSKKTDEFFEQLKDGEPTIGAIEAVREGIKEGVGAFMEGLGQVWDAAKPMFDHGRSEAAAALFTGNTHVMYGYSSQEAEQTPTHGLPIEPLQKESDGREM